MAAAPNVGRVPSTAFCRYRLTTPPPFAVQFPKSRHEFTILQLNGGGSNLGGQIHEAIQLLWIENYDEPGHRVSGGWRPAQGEGLAALERVIYREGFLVPWPSALGTILERAVRDGRAERM